MNKIVLSFLLMSFSLQAGLARRGSLVELPAAGELAQRLNDNNCGDFATKTDLLNDVAGKMIRPLGVCLQVNIACEKLCNGHTEDEIKQIEERQAVVITCILQDYPEALEKVQNLDITEITEAIQDPK